MFPLVRRTLDGIVSCIHSVRELLPRKYHRPFLILTQVHAILTRSLSRPWRSLFTVYSPFPPWHFRLPTPLPHKELQSGGPDLFYLRHPNIILLRNIELFKMRDTPLRALYRLYEAVCTGNNKELRHEARYIWESTWTLSSFPDTRDPDPVRYALLAGIMEDLVDAFNWRLVSMGFPRDQKKWRKMKWDRSALKKRTPQPAEAGPTWTVHVPAAPEKVIWNGELGTFNVETMASENCKRRNIWVMTGGMSFCDNWMMWRCISELRRLSLPQRGLPKLNTTLAFVALINNLIKSKIGQSEWGQ